MIKKEKKPMPRRKLRPTYRERELLGKLSERERRTQADHQQRLSELKADHDARVGKAMRLATNAVREAKAVFDTEARKLAATKANTITAAEKKYAKAMEQLRSDRAKHNRGAETMLDDATLASARQRETEAVTPTNTFNEALKGIFAERESIEYGERLKGKARKKNGSHV